MPSVNEPCINTFASPFISEREIDESRPLKVIYIGAGVSGILGAIKFRELVPTIQLVIYEKNPDIGGTWYENSYPGCACDVPSHSYQLSFESSTEWTQFYTTAPEILKYWKAVAKKYHVDELVKFHHKCIEARWDEAHATWRVKFLKLDGAPEPYIVEDTADVLITGTGTLNEWKWPEIAGLNNYQGKLLYSANWDDTFEPSGKKVAVIGGGSSGIQIVPALASKVARMDHYVRGKTWIANQFGEQYVKERGVPSSDGNFTYTAKEREAWRKNPAAYPEYRKGLEMTLQGFYGVSQRGNPKYANIEKTYEEMMRHRLQGKPHLLEKMLPRFPPLCKRLTPGPGYLEALASPNVDVIHTSISHIDSTGIITCDGIHRAVDAVICATGFETSVSSGFPIYGRDGLNLRSKYDNYPRTYLGASVHTYIGKILQRLATGNVRTIEPKRISVDRFTRFCDDYFKRTVYTADCLSWYKTAPPGSSPEERMRGRVTALWPGSSVHAVKALNDVRWEDFDMEYLDGNEFGWFGNGWTVADRLGDVAGLTWYLYNTGFVDLDN